MAAEMGGKANQVNEIMKHKLPVISEWASLVTQWLRIPLPIQGTWVRSLVWDPTCGGATKQAPAPRGCALQQEKPLQREAHTLQLE